jgi:hypothetical protein
VERDLVWAFMSAQLTFGFHRMWWIYWLAKELLVGRVA